MKRLSYRFTESLDKYTANLRITSRTDLLGQSEGIPVWMLEMEKKPAVAKTSVFLNTT